MTVFVTRNPPILSPVYRECIHALVEAGFAYALAADDLEAGAACAELIIEVGAFESLYGKNFGAEPIF